MKIDSYANIILTVDNLFQQVQSESFDEPIELAKYNVMVKLIETQLKAIEKQKLLDTTSIDETKLTKLEIIYTTLTVDDEKKGIKTKKTIATNSKRKSSKDNK